MKFTTRDYDLSIFLHATEKLPFLGCKKVTPTQVAFVFDDPDNTADACENDFVRGEEVVATLLFASQRFLRRKIQETLAGGR